MNDWTAGRMARAGVLALLAASVSGAAPSSAMAQQISFDAPGADAELARRLREASLMIAADAEDVTDPQELLAAARADYGRLIGALYNRGHFGGIINILVDGREAAEIPPLAQIGEISSIDITVRPGPAYLFDQAAVVPLAPGTDLPEGFAVGQPARTPLIEDAARAAVSAWRDVGRAKADIAEQQVTARHDEERLSVRIGIAPGPVVTFGDLILRGDRSVRPERLRAIAGLPTGEVFSPAELAAAERRLRRTEVFSSVALTEAETLGPGDTLEIAATLAAFPRRRFGFGAEVSTVEGLTLTSYWLNRNLLGGAERLRIDGAVSGLGGGTGGIDYSLAARFGRPATFRPNVDLFVIAELAHLDEPDFTSDIATLGFGLARTVNERFSTDIGLTARYSQVEDDESRLNEPDDTRTYALLSLPIGALYDGRDDRLNAKAGIFADIEVAPFLGLNDETDSGARLTFDARTYYSPGTSRRVTLAGRVQGGSILGADLTGVPNDYRFYTGGGGTVRGQDYQSLGVVLPSGTETGGLSFLALSTELRAEVTDRIGLVAFADIGIVGRDAFPDGDSEDHAGAGLGLRYLTPIGPIRLDVAAPLSGDSEGVEVYVGIGQSF